MIKICKRDGCNVDLSQTKNKVFCSADCRLADIQDNYERVMCANPTCQVQFKASKTEKRKYCSRSCSAQVNSYKNTRSRPQGSCKACGTVISKSRKYCDAHKYTSRSGLILESYDDGSVRCANTQCQRLFTPSGKFKAYCSIDCRTWSPSQSERKKDTCGFKGCKNDRVKISKTCNECSSEYKFEEKIRQWLTGEYSGGSVSGISVVVRKYLLREADYSCSKCGFNTPHPDGSSILEIDHINGDSSDHSPKNVRVLCPNCHALTPTHRARNMGKGRRTYYKKITPKELGRLDLLDDEGAVMVE